MNSNEPIIVYDSSGDEDTQQNPMSQVNNVLENTQKTLLTPSIMKENSNENNVTANMKLSKKKKLKVTAATYEKTAKTEQSEYIDYPSASIPLIMSGFNSSSRSIGECMSLSTLQAQQRELERIQFQARFKRRSKGSTSVQSTTISSSTTTQKTHVDSKSNLPNTTPMTDTKLNNSKLNHTESKNSVEKKKVIVCKKSAYGAAKKGIKSSSSTTSTLTISELPPKVTTKRVCKSCGATAKRIITVDGMKEEPLMQCTSCNSVWYCDKECQSKDWPAHQLVCNDTKKSISSSASQNKVHGNHHIVSKSNNLPAKLERNITKKEDYIEIFDGDYTSSNDEWTSSPKIHDKVYESIEIHKKQKTSKVNGNHKISKKVSNKMEFSSVKETSSTKTSADCVQRDYIVVHSTGWRNIRLDTPPATVLPNLIDVDGYFISKHDRPLTSYDYKNELESKCAIDTSSNHSYFEKHPIDSWNSQGDVNEKISKVVQEILPRLQECHEKRSMGYIIEMRERVRAYKKKLNSWKANQREVKCIPLNHPLTKIESKISKNGLVYITNRSVKYDIWTGEYDVDVETIECPNIYTIGHVQPLSSSTSLIGLKSSMRVDDDPICRHVPYFGDQDDGEAIAGQYESIKAREQNHFYGLDGEVQEYLLRSIIAACGTSDAVFTALKKLPAFEQGYTEYQELKVFQETQRISIRRLQEFEKFVNEDMQPKENIERINLLRNIENQRESLVDKFSPQVRDFYSYFLQSYISGDQKTSLGVRSTDKYQDVVDTYQKMFCRMCYKFDCHVHGTDYPLPSHRTDPVYPRLFINSQPTLLSKGTLEVILDDENESLDNDVGCTDREEQDQPTPFNDRNYESEDDILEFSIDGNVKRIKNNESLRRRSARSQTRISSRATESISLQQIKLHQKPPIARPARNKPLEHRRGDDESEYLDDSHSSLVTSLVSKFLAHDKPCSESCWKTSTSSGEDIGEFSALSIVVDAKAILSQTEMVFLQKLRQIVGNNSCMISSILPSVSCTVLHQFLAQENQNKEQNRDGEGIEEMYNSGKDRKRNRRSVSASNNRILLNRTRTQRAKDGGSQHEYEPCKHTGSCDSLGCNCMKRNHNCEKGCSCSLDCPNRFPGCKCSLGNCRTNSCPCYIGLRECNPDLCTSCGASEAALLLYNKDRHSLSASEIGICCNVNILRGNHKKLRVGFSKTHGWGAFAGERIKRNEFIYEYTGAIISQDEAERRGSIYDKNSMSFLFDLNEDSVIDAVRKGNKSKFANHKAIGQKCGARVMCLCGEHRIGIFAKQDINEGEELFFNYGYSHDTAPDWSKFRISGSKES